MAEGGSITFDLPPDANEHVDISTFEQILEMDDGDMTREFSRGLVFGFFEQASTTFDQINKAVKSRDLPQLSSLGHFLKGSSATLGLYKIRDSCEKIQHWGAMKDETGNRDVLDKDKCLENIKGTIPGMLKDYADVEKWLTDFFGPEPDDEWMEGC